MKEGELPIFEEEISREASENPKGGFGNEKTPERVRDEEILVEKVGNRPEEPKSFKTNTEAIEQQEKNIKEEEKLAIKRSGLPSRPKRFLYRSLMGGALLFPFSLGCNTSPESPKSKEAVAIRVGAKEIEEVAKSKKEAKITGLEAEILEKQSTSTDLKVQILKKEVEVDRLKEEISKIDVALKDLKTELIKKEEDLTDAQEMKAEKEMLEKEVDALENKVKSTAQELSKLQDQLKPIIKELNELREKSRDLQKELGGLKDIVADAQKPHKQGPQKRPEVKQSERKLSDNERDFQETLKAYDKLFEDLAEKAKDQFKRLLEMRRENERKRLEKKYSQLTFEEVKRGTYSDAQQQAIKEETERQAREEKDRVAESRDIRQKANEIREKEGKPLLPPTGLDDAKYPKVKFGSGDRGGVIIAKRTPSAEQQKEIDKAMEEYNTNENHDKALFEDNIEADRARFKLMNLEQKKIYLNQVSFDQTIRERRLKR